MPDDRDWLHVDKEWLCNVLSSIDFEGIQKMILEARKKRKTKLEKQNDLMVEISPEFEEALKDCQTFSCKLFLRINPTLFSESKGKVLSSLKKGSIRKRTNKELEEVKEVEEFFKSDK